MNARTPVWLVTYEGADVSDDIAPMVTTVEYVDHVSPAPEEKGPDGKPKPAPAGEAPKDASDELSLSVEDRVGRWRAGWFPASGDKVRVQMGYAGEPLLNCGEFAIDEVEMAGPPDAVAVRAMATPMTEALRSPQSRAFEGTTLRTLIQHVADELELELVGEVAELPIERVTQTSETTLAFVRRLAAEYGYTFAIRPPSLVFYELAKLHAEPPVLTVRRRDLRSYRLKSSVQGTYAACVLSWFDPATKELREVRVDEQYTRQVIVIGGEEGGGDAAAAEAPPTIPTRLLQVGVQGDDVRGWQAWGTSRGIAFGPIDGIFGPLTRGGTIEFQRQAGIAVDGIAGPETFRAAVELGYGSAASASALGTGEGTRAETSGAILRVEERVETVEQAEARARALLAAANRLRATGSLALVGDPRLVAGANIQLEDMGRLGGKFSITKSVHRMQRSGGYTTDVEVVGV